MGECYVPIRLSKHIPVGSYLNLIPYLIFMFFAFRAEIIPILDLMYCTLVLLIHTHGGEWVNSQMGSIIVAVQEIGECLHISQRLPICHVLQNCFSESAIETFHYLSFDILKSGKMVHTLFPQQLFHMPIVKLFSLVCVQLFRITHMIESPLQGCSHFLSSFPLDGDHKSQLRKTVYDRQDKSVARIISFQFRIIDQIRLILVLYAPSQNLSPSEFGFDSPMKSVRLLCLRPVRDILQLYFRIYLFCFGVETVR